VSYQWRLAGQALPGQTSRTLNISSAQPADEGDYTVVVSNAFGAVTNDPSARLYVLPPISELVRGDFTNQMQRLPYYLHLPTNYDAARRYPLIIFFHGSGDETTFLSDAAARPARLVYASFTQQAEDPAIIVSPTRRSGDNSWTDAYLQLVSGLLDKLLSEFSVDTNRVYIGGGSEGGHAAWDLAALRRELVAGVVILAGWQGTASATTVRHLPFWVFAAADDATVPVSNSRNLVQALRRVGGNPIYTEYRTGGHGGSITNGLATPAQVNWIRAQRRGTNAPAEPLLLITNPPSTAIFATAKTNLILSGTADALGQNVSGIAWENAANAGKGAAFGSSTWSATGIPISAGRTNVIIVTATTTSWAPGFGGNTTFNHTLTVFNSPIRTALVLQGLRVSLSWNGGTPPFQVQRATNLSSVNWQNILTNAVSPVVLPVEGDLGIFRVLGQ
jgi:poly(3-hydroxybutyrate) depolymerase